MNPNAPFSPQITKPSNATFADESSAAALEIFTFWQIIQHGARERTRVFRLRAKPRNILIYGNWTPRFNLPRPDRKGERTMSTVQVHKARKTLHVF